MNERLYRSTQDKVIAGVCGGLAERFDLDPSLVRVGFIVLGVVTAVLPMVIIYVAMAVIVPEPPIGAYGGPGAPGVAGVTGTAAMGGTGGTADPATAGGSGTAESPGSGTGAPGVTASATTGYSGHARRHRRGDRTGAVILGALFIVAGVAFLVRQYVHIDWDQVWPVILIGFGAFLVLVSFFGRSGNRDKP